MKRSSLYLFVLAVAAPFCAEILNGSTPITALASPLVWIFTLLPYSLLIIGLGYFVSTARTPASILFLLPIAGLVIEGLLTQSFFNPAFRGLTVLAGIGMFVGVQWPWVISLVASHMMTSFLLPLAIAGYFVPNERVSKKFAVIALTALAFILIFGFFIASADSLHYALQLIATIAIIFLLVFLSRSIALPQSDKKSLSSGWFFIIGFLFAPANWLTSFFLAAHPVGYILSAEAIFLLVYLYFLWSQWWNPTTDKGKRITFVVGYFIPYLIAFCLISLSLLR
jgi:hypothetical protein